MPINDDIIAMVAIVGGLVLGALAIVCGTVYYARRNASREESRREIAAYVAEGSMTAEEGERLMRAGNVDV